MRQILILLLMTVFGACTQEHKNPSPAVSSMETCKTDHFTCAAVKLEDAQASEAYTHGCNQKDYYSCYRLGQYHEQKSKNVDEALKAYEVACGGKDFYGCRSEQELRAKLCYVEKKSSYCKGEPAGEMRLIAFLAEQEPRYKDAFVGVKFATPFSMELTRNLYAKRREEKSHLLLEALQIAKSKSAVSGPDLEALNAEIKYLEMKN